MSAQGASAGADPEDSAAQLTCTLGAVPPAPTRMRRTQPRPSTAEVSPRSATCSPVATVRAISARSCNMVGTAMNALTLCRAMILRADAGSNLGMNTCVHPAMSAANAEERPPMWESGARCK
ncbi:hypothetical protein Vretimale_1546 [Volvox reticuliferus]|uniref:Uncharacterized protein n=1 Tax=Volvox reticuliferus TaxID=1737510 RepID=A0A8J4D4K5_9CHLO|nr:hypothetical protein Vretimale_1546 [Volvox reticuliferus]